MNGITRNFKNFLARARPTIASRSIGQRLPAVASVHTVPDLPYAYNALEPHISSQIMELHHKKHHQAYVTGLNAAEEAYSKASTAAARIALQPAIKFNGGGHINHSFFWKILSPDGGKLTEGPLKKAIDAEFGGFDSFKKDFNAKAAAVQGSGWGWLVYNSTTKKLEIITTQNQDPVLSPYSPIIGIDVWEHAYYLQYKNVRPDYLNAIWNVINFKEANTLYTEATNH